MDAKGDMMEGLEFYTNQELIDELYKRQTFTGIIIASDKEGKCNTLHENWEISYCNLSEKQVFDIMQENIHHFEKLYEEES